MGGVPRILTGGGGGGATLNVLSITFMCGVACGSRCVICGLLAMWDFCVLAQGVLIALIGGVGDGAMLSTSFVMHMCGVTCGIGCIVCWLQIGWDFCVLVWVVSIVPIGGGGCDGATPRMPSCVFTCGSICDSR